VSERAPELHRTLARAAAAAFGGQPSVHRYWDQTEHSSVDLLSAADAHFPGVTSYATIGLCEQDQGLIVESKPLRIELLAAGYNRFEFLPNILTTCVFNVINSGYVCRHGATFPEVVHMYLPSALMKHILFTSPFLWEGQFEAIYLPERAIAWLLAVPISEEELQYAERRGSDALESLLQEREIDVFDLSRPCVA